MKAGLRVRALLVALGDRVLRASDPWIGRRVRTWLGDQADHGRLALDGTSLRITGAKIPLGARFAIGDVRMQFSDVIGLVARGETRVRVDHAELIGVPGLSSLGATAAVTVSKSRWRVDDGIVSCGDARATVSASGSFGDVRSARASVKLDRVGAAALAPLLAAFATDDKLRALRVPDDAVVSGDVTWDDATGTTAALVIATAKSRVRIALMIDAHGKLGDTRIDGTIAIADALGVRALSDADRARVEAIGESIASLGVVVGADRAVGGTIEIATATSAIVATLAIAGNGALAGTKLRGALSFLDAVTLGIFPGNIRPRRIGVMTVDADVEGKLTEPALAGRVTSPELRLRLGDDATLPTIVFHEVGVRLHVDARGLEWKDLAAQVLGGALASSGSVRFDHDVGLDTAVALTGVHLEAIPSNADGARPLAEKLRGALHTDLRVTYAAGALPAFLVRGPLRVVDPDFLFIASAGEKLASYGLPAPETRGAGPIEAEIDIRERVVRIAPIAAHLDGIDIEGEVSLAFDGALRGELRAQLLQGYLRRSLLLAVPAALADRVTVPIAIGGTVRDPIVSADFVHTLDDFLQKNAIGSAVTGVMDEIWSTLGGPRTRRSSHPPAPVVTGDPLDAIFDRILAGDADADRLIDQLVDAGLDAEQIEERLARRRKR